jgi:hypothetical protein
MDPNYSLANLKTSMGLAENESLVDMILEPSENRMQIRDLSRLFPALSTSENTYLQHKEQWQQIKRLFAAGRIHVMQQRTKSPENAGESANAEATQKPTLKVQGKVKDQIDEMLSHQSAKITYDGEETQVQVEADEQVSERVNQVAMQTLEVVIIDDEVESPVKEKEPSQPTPHATSQWTPLRESTRKESTTAVQGGRQRDRSESRVKQEEDTAEAAQERQSREKETQRKDINKRERREALEENRSVRFEAQELGTKTPKRKTSEVSERPVEKRPKKPEQR